MINVIWLVLIVSGIVIAAITGQMDKVSDAIFNGATDSVNLAIKLLGPMALWMGIMNIAEEAGLTEIFAKIMRPVFHIIFPDLNDSPAIGSILLNMSANILGLGNSATPLGIQAMQNLQKINSDKEKASPAMCTLLALNTSSITLVPATIISLRAATGSTNPAIIIITTIFATGVSTLTALLMDKTFRTFYGD